ncbi:MAG TPA: ABC transporter ATP-binding protein [Bryobacteraceae bacterium]|nr:ABC transporter ATP-binding protein [Bryobacteraceae bacterium]
MIRIEKLSRIYRSGEDAVVVFRDLDLAVSAGEQVAIMGASGAGKSTLLHLLAGLDTPTAGAIYYKDRDITKLGEPEMARFRNREIGYVWQQHHLMQEFSALENTMMPLMIRGDEPRSAEAAARQCLEEVGLGSRVSHRAGELSGGEQQRVAIARALAGSPSLLLADEPTGNLDEGTGEVVFALLADLRERRGLTTVLVTHNAGFAKTCGRVLKLERGGLHPIE